MRIIQNEQGGFEVRRRNIFLEWVYLGTKSTGAPYWWTQECRRNSEKFSSVEAARAWARDILYRQKHPNDKVVGRV